MAIQLLLENKNFSTNELNQVISYYELRNYDNPKSIQEFKAVNYPMSIFKKEIDKIAVVREQQLEKQEEDKAFEGFKKMSYLEAEELREKDFDTWIKFSKREQEEK